jgi:hypothetical protein
MRPNGIAALELELQAEGFQKGTPAFDAALLQRQVERCRDVKGVTTCQDCGYFDHCTTAKQFLVHLRYNRTPQAEKELVVQDRLPDWLFPPETKAHDSNTDNDAEAPRRPGTSR